MAVGLAADELVDGYDLAIVEDLVTVGDLVTAQDPALSVEH